MVVEVFFEVIHGIGVLILTFGAWVSLVQMAWWLVLGLSPYALGGR